MPHQQHARKGQLKRTLGWLTADRIVEARGEAETTVADHHPSAATVARTVHLVKIRYDEAVEVPPARTFHPIE
jgi:hypothetical protein